MRKKQIHYMIVLLLVLILGVSTAPNAAMAENSESTRLVIMSDRTLGESVNIGMDLTGDWSSLRCSYYFGEQDGKPILWRMLEGSKEKMLLLSDEILTSMHYRDTSLLELNVWKDSNLRTYLNSTEHDGFMAGLPEALKTSGVLVPATIIEKGQATYDKVYLLSIDEVEALTNDERNISGYWWLRSAGNSGRNAAFVDENGFVDTTGIDVYDIGGVRPAIKLDPENIIFASLIKSGAKKNVGETEADGIYTEAKVGSKNYKLTILGSNNGADVGTLTGVPGVLQKAGKSKLLLTGLLASKTDTDYTINYKIIRNRVLKGYGYAEANSGTLTINTSGLTDGEYDVYVWLQKNNTASSHEGTRPQRFSMLVGRDAVTNVDITPGTGSLEAADGDGSDTWEYKPQVETLYIYKNGVTLTGINNDLAVYVKRDAYSLILNDAALLAPASSSAPAIEFEGGGVLSVLASSSIQTSYPAMGIYGNGEIIAESGKHSAIDSDGSLILDFGGTLIAKGGSEASASGIYVRNELEISRLPLHIALTPGTGANGCGLYVAGTYQNTTGDDALDNIQNKEEPFVYPDDGSINPEETPQAQIDYIGEKLTNLRYGHNYLVNGAPFTAVGGEISIEEEWIGKVVFIIKKSDGTNTSNSAPQQLVIPARMAPPAEITAVGVSSELLSDGKITGVDPSMEYSNDGGIIWQDCPETEITGLGFGEVYWVRLKAADTAFTGMAATVRIDLEIIYSPELVVSGIYWLPEPSGYTMAPVEPIWIMNIGNGEATIESVTVDNVSLTVTGAVYGSIITWTSSNTAVISDRGVVTRPSFSSGDAAVTVTASVYNDGASTI